MMRGLKFGSSNAVVESVDTSRKNKNYNPWWLNIWNRLTGAGLTNADYEANNMNRDNLDYQSQKEYELWLKTESAQAQVQDALAAGLNPANLYGSGSIAGSVPGLSMSNVSADSGDPVALLSLVANLASMKTDLQYKKAMTDKISAESEGIKIDNEHKPEEWEQKVALFNQSIKESESKLSIESVQRELAKSRIRSTDAKTALIELNQLAQRYQNEYAVKMMESQLALEQAQTALMNNQSSESIARVKNMQDLYNLAVQEFLVNSSVAEAELYNMAARLKLDEKALSQNYALGLRNSNISLAKGIGTAIGTLSGAAIGFAKFASSKSAPFPVLTNMYEGYGTTLSNTGYRFN